MKRIVFILSLLTLIQLTVHSQNNDSIKEHYLGFGGAYTIYTIVTEPSFEYEGFFDTYNEEITSSFFYDRGWTGGIAYKYYTQKLVGLALELNYTKKGGYNVFLNDTSALSSDTTSVLFRHDLEYFELPFMMNIRFGKKRLKFNLYAGPHIAYLNKQSITYLAETYGRIYKSEADFKFEFGLNGGGGISYQYNRHCLEIGVRYSHGLTNIFKYGSINSALFNQNQVISGRLNYYFIF